MSLKKYKQKRSFKSTPEPAGRLIKAKGKPLIFVVHEHHASHLHYDLRLEMEGVLKSWAVPKGPSMQVGAKRLAVQVEDHPFDYAGFKGVIPEGNYGAGVVKIWDNGNYHAFDAETEDRKTNEKLLLAGLKKGHISFVVDGHKNMKGAFDLVRMKDGKNWLLVKKTDKHEEKKKLRIFKVPESKVFEGGLNLPKLKKMPAGTAFIKPMLATLVEEPFDREGWIFEIKWDGYRAITQIDKKGKPMLASRHGLSYNGFFQPIVESLKKIKTPMILDGEVVVVDDKGRADFQLLQGYRNTGEGNLVYYVFDILSYKGKDVRDKTLAERKKLLEKVLPDLSNVKYSSHVESKGKDLFESAVKMNLEGIMAKNLDSKYLDGDRSKNWLKIKNINEQEVIICGMTKPRGSRTAFGALVMGVYKKGVLTYIGHTGTGFTDESLRETYNLLKPLVTKKSPFVKVPKTNMPVQWVKPELVCEVKFANWTEEGYLRQPVFLGLRSDKKAKDVVREKPNKVAAIAKSKSGKVKSNKVAKVKKSDSKEEVNSSARFKVESKNVDGVHLTNLDKIYWPKEKYTKGDLIDYYEKIAPYILPYLKDRPESLHRYPNGIEGEDFFQKDFLKGHTAKHVPKGLRTVGMYSEKEKKTVNYLLCQDKETLLFMANLGCIDMNPWNSRHDKPDNPDYMILDLDPLEISFNKVIETAQAAKKLLDKIGVPSFPKTSGATGMHIVIPLGALYKTEQVVQFANLLAIKINLMIPKITSLERSPAKRNRKVYLDYLQNRQNQTIASVYCVRPRKGATVSTPLKWSEVKKGMLPTDFTIKNIFKRLEKVGDLWKGVLGKGINMQKALKMLEKL